MWNSPMALTPDEQKIAVRTRTTRTYFGFLRARCHAILAADGQHTLARRDSPERLCDSNRAKMVVQPSVGDWVEAFSHLTALLTDAYECGYCGSRLRHAVRR